MPGRHIVLAWLAVVLLLSIPAHPVRAATDDATSSERREDAPGSDSAPTAAVLARFLARPDEPVLSFRARRALHVTSGALGKEAWMEVLVEADPLPLGFRFQVLAAGGSKLLQEKILLGVLRAEQDVYASGGNPKAALTADNYRLAPGGYHGPERVRLLATARRKEVGLLNGHFLVNAHDADLLEVSGTLAKGPSFWIRRVELTKRYARIAGRRVNVEVESVSHLRLLGRSRFTMTTHYEQIDGAWVAEPEPTAERP